jgi:hypothetical protein
MVQVVENDDDIGKFRHLGSELLEQGRAQSTPVHGRQGTEISEFGPDGGKPAQQLLGEMDRIVIRGVDLQPDEAQVGAAGRPLGEQHGLSGPRRGHNERQWLGQRLIEPVAKHRPVDGMCRWNCTSDFHDTP